MDGLTRRRLLEAAGAAGAASALGRVPLDALAAARAAPHQPGIATRAPAHLRFAAYDATAADRNELRDLMRDWSQEATRLMKRHRRDHLTITFGFGPALFDAGRYGLQHKRPPALNRLPAFFGDALDPATSDGDLAIQICADDEDVTAAALRRFAGTPRWTAKGRIGTHGTPRNKMGFKDGTNNIAGDDRTAMRHSVWVGPRDNPA